MRRKVSQSDRTPELLRKAHVMNAGINLGTMPLGNITGLFQGNSPGISRCSVTKTQALSAWPIFGGTTPGGDTGTPPAAPPATDPPAPTPPAPTTPPDDPVAKLQADPNALSQLLDQVTSLNKQVQTLSTENQGFKDAQTAAERAQQTKEQQLETDLANERARTEKAINLLNQKTLENALLSHKDYVWHDAHDALNNLKDHPEVKITVDIENGVASIEGMEKAVKELATKKPWMLSKGPAPQQNNGNQQQNNGTPPAGRPTGTPPPPAGNQSQADKATRRKALSEKYSAIRSAPVVAR